MIVYNRGLVPVFISTGLIPDPRGAPGDFETKYIIEPGQGIDLSILNLEPSALVPEETPCAHRWVGGIDEPEGCRDCGKRRFP